MNLKKKIKTLNACYSIKTDLDYNTKQLELKKFMLASKFNSLSSVLDSGEIFIPDLDQKSLESCMNIIKTELYSMKDLLIIQN